MHKVAVLILADSELHGDMGRITNAPEIAKEFQEHNDEVQIILMEQGLRGSESWHYEQRLFSEGKYCIKPGLAAVKPSGHQPSGQLLLPLYSI
jgi:hypothetical protein